VAPVCACAGPNGVLNHVLGITQQILHRPDQIVTKPLYGWCGELEDEPTPELEFQVLTIQVLITSLGEDEEDDREGKGKKKPRKAQVADREKVETLERMALCDVLRMWGHDWPALHDAVIHILHTFPVLAFRQRLGAYLWEFVDITMYGPIPVSPCVLFL